MERNLPQLWQWAEYYCPWCYVTAVRLQRILPEYGGRVRLVTRAFPLEVYGGGPPDRTELELEIWLAALQEPDATFKPFGSAWPTTTLPAFDAAWAAFRQGEETGHAFDLRIRHVFFAEGRDIGSAGVMQDLAREADLDMQQFMRDISSGAARAAVLAEGQLGKQDYGVRSTPTLMLSNGKRLRHPLSYPKIDNGAIQSVDPLPCYGEGCDAVTRDFFKAALHLEAAESPQRG